MYFKTHLTAVANILDVRFHAMGYPDQNNADRGELCEIFLKQFPSDVLSSSMHVFRGGKIIGLNVAPSSQMDVIVTSRNSLKLFSDKQVYPIETVAGAFCVTSTLTERKLQEDIMLFQSIPKADPHFATDYLQNGTEGPPILLAQWAAKFPFKCVFAFQGEWSRRFIDVLTTAASGEEAWRTLPDLVVINKRGMLVKAHSPDPLIPGPQVPRYDSYDLAESEYHLPLAIILDALFNLSQWQARLVPDYGAYFMAEI